MFSYLGFLCDLQEESIAEIGSRCDHFQYEAKAPTDSTARVCLGLVRREREKNETKKERKNKKKTPGNYVLRFRS